MTDGRVIAFTGKHHGLGNRMRVVLGTRSLARWADREFGYTWPTGPQFGARLDEMWRIDDRRVPVALSKLLSVRHPYRKAGLEWLDAASGDSIWQIRTAHALHLPAGAGTWGQELRALGPVPEIEDRVRSFHDRDLAGKPYVGVMVRAHSISHSATLESSPVDWYIDRMRDIREDRPGIRFFVSADTPAAQAQVLEAVPGSVALDDKGPYNSKRALLSSVVDLYLLAGSGHLLGPHFSSFPEMAQQLGGAGLRLETSKSPEGAALRGTAPLEYARDPLVPSARTV